MDFICDKILLQVDFNKKEEKHMKKTLSIILAILIIVSTIPMAFAVGDGAPLEVNLEDKGNVILGQGEAYYDEDGYIFSGKNEDCSITLQEESDFILDNMSAFKIGEYFDDGEVNILLKGDNLITYSWLLGGKNNIIEAEEGATLIAPSFNTSGRDGIVTINGGDITLKRILSDSAAPSVNCENFVLNGGTVTASHDKFHTVTRKVTLNGGVFNVKCTSSEHGAIAATVTMNKGALLIVESSIGKPFEDATMKIAEGLLDNDCFFVRFDKESEFQPAYLIKRACDGKNYVEIKVNTHEHILVDDRCVCGYDQIAAIDPEPDPVCEHLCHSKGVKGFFWKIVQFFTKLFKINPVCECGEAHY